MVKIGSGMPVSAYQATCEHLSLYRYSWLVTGAAGFIGSALVERLLFLGQAVTGLDNFSTGHAHNLDDVRDSVGDQAWTNFRFIQGDIRDPETCASACDGMDYVLHEAALGSVPRSIQNPILTNANNVTGFLNMLVASRDAGVKRMVYAASSSTYGDNPTLPKTEPAIGKPLSPYAVTKYVNELYAEVFARCYEIETIGLRYFNVFGPRQDPQGAYASVIPRWIVALMQNLPVEIHGDGHTSRDFCFIDNVVQANLLAAMSKNVESVNQIYNVALGERTSLIQLYGMLKSELTNVVPSLESHSPRHGEFRPGDVRHSQADVSKAIALLGYEPGIRIREGLSQTIAWFSQKHALAC